ncbi:YoaK family protein [Leptolyngbya sp. AN03gr2]|uniref:YoaK family protein n=1 Tax=unclassified Leptolyngbya TaxID=2650499 RepID=UPI003D31DD20
MTVSLPEKEAFSLSAFLTSDGPARFLLSWVAGFVDTAAFITLFGIFTAHVTGNIALAGSAFASSDPLTTVLRLSMLPVFMLAVVATSLTARFARKRGWAVLPVLLIAEAIALGIFMVVGLQYSATLVIDAQDYLMFPIAVTGVIAMGIQNALMKEAATSFTGFFPTTVMTGNFTNFTINLVHYVSAKLSQPTEETKVEATYALTQIKLTSPLLIGFFLGGTGAAYFVPSAEFWSLSIPLLIVTMLAVAAYIQSSEKTQNV